MCKIKIKAKDKLVPWLNFGAGMPQLHPLLIDLLVPPYVNFQLIQTEGNRFFELLPFDMPNEEKKIIIQRHLQIFLNRHYGY